MNDWRAPLLVFGGTFDPVHDGHRRVALAAADLLGSRCALLVPCGDPAHRGAPLAPGQQRATMLRLAFADDPRFAVDERELQRPGRSYSVETLSELRRECGPSQPIVLLLGEDAAAGLASWHRAGDLPGLAHLLVATRPQAVVDSAIWQGLGWSAVPTARVLGEGPAGACYRLLETCSTASSTAVRGGLARGTGSEALAPAVADYIRQHGLYRSETAGGNKSATHLDH